MVFEKDRRQPLAIALLILAAGGTCGHKQSPEATPPPAAAVLPPAEEDVEEHTAKPIQTDFPFQILALGTNSPVSQIVNKSVTIRLGEDAAVSFDTDLLRMGAGWTGEFVKATGVTFDASHGNHPSAGGKPHFVTAPVPGWADASGRFQDPRRIPFGPIPESWGRWDGLYVSGNTVVLGYTVNGAKIFEQPSAVRAAGEVGFARTFRIENLGRPLALLVADVPAVDEGQKSVASADVPIRTLSVTGGPAGAKERTEVALLGGPTDSRLETNGSGRIVLHLPRSKSAALFKVIVTRSPVASTSALAALTEASGPPQLVDFRTGGPRHWPTPIVTRGNRAEGPGPYLVDRITTPFPGVYQGAPREGDWKDNIFQRRIMIAGFDFFPDGTRAALSTWEGDVWIVEGIDGDLDKLTWRRFASGLFEPLGLAIVGGVVHTSGRDQITRLHDLNGDGEADFYENFNNQVTSSQGFHEFQFDLQTDARGNFYTAKAAPVRAGGRGFGGGGGNGVVTPFAGTVQRISPDGKRREIIATGLRAPNGIGVSPEGQVTTGDNEGTWMPACPINWVRPGSFHGVEDVAHRKPAPKFDPPLCWISKSYDNSGGAQVWVPSDKWGPWKGELLHLSYGRASIYLVLKQQVDSLMQGGIVRLVGGPDATQTTGTPVKLSSSAMRARFNPVDGQLYVAGLSGWQSDAVALTGFDRIRYTGKEVYSLRGLQATSAGVELTFTHALDPSSLDPQNFSVERWNYQRSSQYGSPEFSVEDPGRRGHDRVEIREARLEQDGKSVLLDIDDLRPVHQMLLQLRVKASDGTPIRQSVMFTIHKLPRDPRARQRQRVASARPRGEPGLLLRLAPDRGAKGTGAAAVAHTEVAPVVKLEVGKSNGRDATASPFLPPGPFTATWQGFLWPELRGDHILEAEVTGELRVTLNGQVVLTSDGSGRVRSKPLPLDRKANGLEVHLRGASGPTTALRLSWARLDPGDNPEASARNPRFEPIPLSAFRHERTREIGAELNTSLARKAGRELFLEHRCAQCHVPEAQRGASPELGARAPSFVAIGSRLDQRWLRDWILDPRAQRSSARMPALLHGREARPDAEAIAAYLASLRDPKLASRHEENAHAVRAAGERAEPGSESGLIGKLRCGGCHVDQSQAADDGRLSMQARKFLPGSLAAYLEDPTAHYPWNPMPHFRLSRGEAQELEAALRLEGGRRARPTAASPPGEQMLARGRDLVETTGCLNCHEAPGTGLQNRAALATSFTGRATSSCLLGTGPARHAFRPQEIAQLQQFLAGGLDPLLRHVPAEFAARQVRQLRCNGCHGHFEGIPDLDRLGEKLRPEWMAAFLAGRIPYKPRGEAHPDGQPWLPARMPAFPAQAQLLAAGLAAQAGYPAHTPADNRLDPALAETGATLVSARGGFSCVACHGVGNQPPTQVFEAEGINLKYSAERLRPEFFRRWLLDPMRVDPSTRMPNYFDETGKSPLIGVLGGQADAQIEAIWHYLRQLGGEKPDVPRTSATKPPVIPVASAP